MEWYRVRIWASWGFAVAGGLVGAAVGEREKSASLLAAMIGAYVAWALFWGVPPVWRGWCSLLGRHGCIISTTPIGWLILLLAFFYVPIVGGYVYGVFGGAIFEFLKSRRAGAGRSPNAGFTSLSRAREPTIEEMMADAEARRSYDSAAAGPRPCAHRRATEPTERQEESTGGDEELSTAEALSILGVSETASRDEIRTAFREQMKKYHPDRVEHLGDEFRRIAEQRSRSINRAYECLTN